MDHPGEHSYEELRELVVAILMNAAETGVTRFETLIERSALELKRRDGGGEPGRAPRLHQNDGELILEIVWDLFRQGVLTFGLNASNPGWPWLRVTRFGECALSHGLFRFHNKAEFLRALHSDAIDVSAETIAYFREAVSAFYADCLLSAAVLLGMAAEVEFLRLCDAAKGDRTHGGRFARIADGLTVRAKILRFGDAIRPVLASLPGRAAGDLDDAIATLQAILRAARDESGQPSGAAAPSRDEVFVTLQLFIPLAEQLTRLRHELGDADIARRVGAP